MSSFENNLIKIILIVFYSMMNHDNVYCPTVQECQNNMKKFCDNYLTSVIDCAKEAITKYQPKPEIIIRRPMSIQRIIMPRLTDLYITSDNERLFTSDDERTSITSDDERTSITSDDERTSITSDDERTSINSDDERTSSSSYSDINSDDEREFNQIKRIPNYIIQYFANYVQPFISTTETLSVDYYCKSNDFFEDEDFKKYFLAMQRLLTVEELIPAAVAVCKKRLEFLRECSMMDIFIKDENFSTHSIVKMYLKNISSRITLNNDVQGELKSPIEFCQTLENH